MNYDVIIIGAGIVGGAIARELSKYKLSVLALEKEADICCGTSKANTGIIHTPALIPPDSLKAEMAVAGAAIFDNLSVELGFGYQKTGALVLGYHEDDEKVLRKYMKNGRAIYRRAGLEPPEYEIISDKELFDMEPALNPDIKFALRAPDTGRIIPYEYGIALWENAVKNGVQLELSTRVEALNRIESIDGEMFWQIRTRQSDYNTRFVVNAAGHGSNELGMSAGFNDGEIRRIKGQYLILDRGTPVDIRHILFQVPQKGSEKKGKGILVTKTVYGNIMIGPDAREQDDDADTSTDIEALDEVVAGALHSIPDLEPSQCIKTFAGVRPRPAGGDFIIENDRKFIHLCGIESPGLTSSPAIAIEVVRRLEAEGLALHKQGGFSPKRAAVVKEVLSLEPDEVKRRIALSEDEPDCLICRCEQVPQHRIIDAISRGIPITTVDGVKRRTRAGQGRCQGGFCGKRVRGLLSSELGLPEVDITQRGTESELERISASEIKAKYGKHSKSD